MRGLDRRTGNALEGADHLRQSIDDILSTPLGTRVGRRDYGSLLPELVDQPANEASRLRLYAATALAILRHESRVRIAQVAILAGATPGSATIRIIGRRTDTPRTPALDLSIPLRALAAA